MSDILNEKGPEYDIAITSRVRLARNLNDMPFPIKMTADQQKKLIEKAKHILSDNTQYGKLMFADMSTLHPLDKISLVERHLISPDLAENSGLCGAFINESENVSIMINEEDHIRIQSIFPGIQLELANEVCQNIDTVIEQQIDYAFDDKYGYLTSCPTNIGTGLRASVMLHLPALVMTGFLKSILDSCNKVGVAIRGLFGEHSDGIGDMFQVSNQITMGRNEKETVSNIDAVCKQIIDREKALRLKLYKQDLYQFEDKIFRSYGLLKNARLLTAQEALKLISDVRLGVSMGIINNVSISDLNNIMVLCQPATLQRVCGKQLNQTERDVSRAQLIRQKLSE